MCSNWDAFRIVEPNDYMNNEDCGTIWTKPSSFTNAGTWNDENCEKPYNYICESKQLLS